MYGMFRQSARMDNEFVNVDIRVLPVCREDLVHGPLKCRWGVTQPKRHDTELETSVFGLECRRRDMLLVDSDFKETLLEVLLGKIPRSAHVVQHFISPR